MRAVLDTSVVIAPPATWTRHPPPTDPTGAALPGELAISAATIAELQFGVLVAKKETVRAARLRRLSRLQRSFEPLPIDDAVAVSYGELAAAVVRAGRQPRARVMDLLIAATAHAHGARLYTRNPDDLLGLDELVEVVPV